MDANIERECSALGSLFQQIITDMRNGAPLWEDLIAKATKLHSCLRSAIVAISAYLEAFQKIADAATSARGATKEIGTALTRICLRQKAVETRMKSFTSAIMDCLVVPLQEKLEEWNKSLSNLYKEHAKEFKKARSELKKRSTDTLKLQKKKARKSQTQIHQAQLQPSQAANQESRTSDVELNRLLESSEASVQEKRQSLEETEKKAVRAALLEERSRFCQLARFLKPVLDEELGMIMELTHLQEVSDQLQRHCASPHHLPAASEQVITDIKGRDAAATQWSLASPPSSPSLSLGSRKSSMCSISSLTSSSSGSYKSHPSPSGHPWHRTLPQHLGIRPTSISGIMTLRHLTNGSSRDSGFTSQDTLYTQPISEDQVSNTQSTARSGTAATWPDLQETSASFDAQAVQNAANERPHTISSAYEKGHQRPALSVYTFQAPDGATCCHSQPASPVSSSSSCSSSNQQSLRKQLRKNSLGNKPPVPNRCSSLERPSLPTKNDSPGSPRGKARLPLPAHLAKELSSHQYQQPMYVNMHELANLAACRAQEMQHPAPPAAAAATSALNNDKTETGEKDGGSLTSESSLESSSGYGSQNTLPRSHSINNQNEGNWNTLGPPSRRGSAQQAAKAPPPPTRRVSAIIGAGNYAATAAASTASGGVTSSTTPAGGDDSAGAGSACDDSENLPPPPAFLLEGSSPTTSPAPQRSVSVLETVRTLTELKHTPASPSLLRKVQQQQVQNQTSEASNVLRRCSTTERRRSRGSSQERGSTSSLASSCSAVSGNQSLMAVLGAKFMNVASSVNSGANSGGGSTANSPKLARKTNYEQQASNIVARSSIEFLETLNAKLAEQQETLQSQGMSNRSASIRRVMGNRVPILDPVQVRGSLMDQIRQGASLRKTRGPINDRSAPKIY